MAPIQDVYDVFSDPARYQQLVPKYYPSVRVLSTRGDVSVAETHVVLGGHELVLMAKHVCVPYTSHEIFVIGGDAKGSHLRHMFEDTTHRYTGTTNDHVTLITVNVNLKLGSWWSPSKLLNSKPFKDDYGRLLCGLADAVTCAR